MSHNSGTCYFSILKLVFFFVTVNAVKRTIPPYVPRCYRNDPNLNDCLLKATEEMRPYLRNGIPEMNLPALANFVIPQVTIEQGTNAVNLKASLINLTLSGLENYKISKFEFDVPNLRFHSQLTIPKLDMKARYSVKGKILVAPIEGSGLLTATFVNSNGTVNQQSKLVKKRQETYLVPVTSKVTIEVNEPVDAKLTGLFDDNESLRQAAGQVISENKQELIEEVRPTIEKVMENIMNDIIFKSLAKIPYDVLYPVSS